MTTPVQRRVVQAFYEAYASRDPVRIGRFLDDEVEWTIGGPIDLLQFCGTRHGKAAVLDLYSRVIPSVYGPTHFEVNHLLVDADCAAMLCRISAIQCGSGRIISYRCAQFMRFRNKKVVEFRAVIDSFDAAEQILGHSIGLIEDVNGSGARVDAELEIVPA